MKNRVAYNVRGNKECKLTLQTNKDENSRQPTMEVQIASHWRG